LSENENSFVKQCKHCYVSVLPRPDVSRMRKFPQLIQVKYAACLKTTLIQTNYCLCHCIIVTLSLFFCHCPFVFVSFSIGHFIIAPFCHCAIVILSISHYKQKSKCKNNSSQLKNTRISCRENSYQTPMYIQEYFLQLFSVSLDFNGLSLASLTFLKKIPEYLALLYLTFKIFYTKLLKRLNLLFCIGLFCSDIWQVVRFFLNQYFLTFLSLSTLFTFILCRNFFANFFLHYLSLFCIHPADCKVGIEFTTFLLQLYR